MMRRTNQITLASAIALFGAVALLGAQQAPPAAKRVVLQQGDLSAAGREAVMARGEFVPGATTGRHTHPGEEIGYVLQGTLTLEVDGKPARTVKTGEFFMVPAGTIHKGT